MNTIRMLPSAIVLTAIMLVISSARDSHAEIDGATVGTVRISDEGVVREIRTYGYAPNSFEHRRNVDRCLVVIHRKGRSAQEYFKTWKPLADKYLTCPIVPKLGKDSWPYSRHFN